MSASPVALLPTSSAVTSVTVHPLVLLSVVDHYKRSASGTKRRSVGVLLGTKERGGKIDVISSFAVPFEVSWDKKYGGLGLLTDDGRWKSEL